MAQTSRFTGADAAGLAVVIIIGGGMAAFRQLAIVPRATVGLCAAPNAPAFCTLRHAVLWAQYEQLFGWASLLFGLSAFILGRRWSGVLAISLGIAAVVNYNATQGIIGAAFGLIAWAGLTTGRYKTA